MRKTITGIVAVLMATSMGCVALNRVVPVGVTEMGDMLRETQVVPLSAADDVGDGDALRVAITMGAGELTVQGGAMELLEAEFATNIEAWMPKVDYGDARLTIAQRPTSNVFIGENARNTWDLRLHDAVPLVLTAELGAGTGTLDLRTLNVRTVDLKVGAGEMSVDLRGSPALERVDADLGAGKFTLDLRGDWARDADVHILGGVGETTLRLPEGVGVQVRVDKGLGAVVARGLERDGNVYVNSLYGQAEVSLTIHVQAGIGQVTLIGEE